MTVTPHPRQAELDSFAEDLVRRGFGEGDEFFVRGHLDDVFLGSEHVGLTQDEHGRFVVYYSDMGRRDELLVTDDLDAAEHRMVQSLVDTVAWRRDLSGVDLAGLDVEVP